MPTYTIVQITTQTRAHRIKLIGTNLEKSRSAVRTIGRVKVNNSYPENWWFGAAVEMDDGKGALLYYINKPGNFVIHRWEQLPGIRRGKGHIARITMSWKIKVIKQDLRHKREVVKAKDELNTHSGRIRTFFEKGEKVDELRDLKRVMPRI